MKQGLTKLVEEEAGHDDGRCESDDSAGQSSAVEVLIDFGVRVECLELAQKVHCSRLTSATPNWDAGVPLSSVSQRSTGERPDRSDRARSPG